MQCKYCDKQYTDLINKSGGLTKHLKSKHGIVDKNALGHFDVITVDDKPTIKCPYCDWTTIDVNNLSGQFSVHILNTHNKSEFECVSEFPDFKTYFNLDKKIDTRYKENYVICKICGKYMKRINNTHLKKHDTTLIEYKQKYGLDDIVSVMSSQLQSGITTQRNITSDYSLNNSEIIVPKSYFSDYITANGKLNLIKHIPSLLTEIRTSQSLFPYPVNTNNDIREIISKIYKYNTSTILQDNVFNNNTSIIGVYFLKTIFKSYWNSKFKDKKSIVDAWFDDDIMGRVIRYIIGINFSTKISDFTIHNVLKGLTEHRLSISFFKPIVAVAIYEKLLTNKTNPTVIDPCVGFGVDC